MPDSPYAVPLDDLVNSVRVPVEEQVEERDVADDPEPVPDLWPQLRWPN